MNKKKFILPILEIKKSPSNILIISAHADDHISCAGTIMKLQEDKGTIPFEVVFTDSSKGQDFRTKLRKNKKNVSEMRKKELSQASIFLGIKQTFLLGETDFQLEYSKRLVIKLAHIIRNVQPQIVFINGEFDAHPDHKTNFKISIDALKLAAMNVELLTDENAFRVPVILCCEQMLPDRVQLLVDVTAFREKKDQLLKIYASQMSPKSLAFEQGMMAVRGYQLRKPNGFFAEAFTLQNEFPILAFERGGDLF